MTETAGETTVLLLARVGEAGRPIRAWQDARSDLLPSPGGVALVANVRPRGHSVAEPIAGAPGDDQVDTLSAVAATHAVPSRTAYRVAEGRWIDVAHVWESGTDGEPNLRWAGPLTFPRSGDGRAELVPLERSGAVVRLW